MDFNIYGSFQRGDTSSIMHQELRIHFLCKIFDHNSLSQSCKIVKMKEIAYIATQSLGKGDDVERYSHLHLNLLCPNKGYMHDAPTPISSI